MSDNLTIDDLNVADSTSIKSEQPIDQPDAGTGVDTLTPAPDVASVGIQPYTDEEYLQSLDSEGGPDKTRMTPAQSATYTKTQERIGREADKGLTQKFQEIANLKRDYETRIKQVQPMTPQQLEQRLTQDYLADPVSTTSRLNNAIYTLEQIPPTDEFGTLNPKYMEARQQIASISGFKDQLRMTAESVSRSESYNYLAHAEVNQLPDYAKMRPIMEKYAATELGLSGEDLSRLTDVNTMGPLAVKLTKALYKITKTMNVAALKDLKPEPNTLARASTTSIKTKDSDSLEDKSYSEYKKARMGMAK